MHALDSPATLPAASMATAPELGRDAEPLSDARALAQKRFGGGDLSGGIGVLIERADLLARKGEFTPALELFAAARDALTARQDTARLTEAVDKMRDKLAQERAEFREAVARRAAPDGDGVRLFAFADSLGLPRVEEAALEDGGVPATYACKIQTLSEGQPTSRPVRTVAECQRYFTTDDVLRRLVELRGSLADALVLVHVGLNDCASRIFSEVERVAVSFLDEPVQKALLNFVRVHRRPIIHRNPEYNYVPLPRFVDNIEKIVKVARVNGARHVAFVTIVQPGLASERHTPHLRWNFSRYNLAIYDAAKRLSAQVVDADRLCWDAGLARALNPDGMHLAAPGHELIAGTYLKLAAPLLAAKQ